MNTDKQNTIDQLLTIGFVENPAEKGTYEFYEDKELLLYTFVEHDNLVNLEDHQIKQICVQCKLGLTDFEKLTEGKLNAAAYLKILQKQKLL